MALVDIVIPQLGEGVTDVTLIKWLKKVGDPINEEEIIIEIATDKVDSEVPSTATGVVKEILFKENDVIPIGTTFAKVETNFSEQSIADANAEDNTVPYVPTKIEETQLPTANHVFTGSNNGFFSPLVLSMAKKENIPFAELEKIKGTGKEGRVTKNDMLRYVENRNQSSVVAVENLAQQTTDTPEPQKAVLAAGDDIPTPVFSSARDEIIEMDRVRKMIAHNMKESQNVNATVTSFAEVDVTNIVQWREQIKNTFEKREGTKITFTPIFIDCIARVLKRYPLLNSTVEGTTITIKKNVNIGMATALPNGNLIVPVIKNADTLSLVGITKQVNTLAKSARNNSLKPTDTQEGTFTVTNIGGFGSLTGTPIIPIPQVAILAIGAIKKRPVVIETPAGDVIGIRQMMILSLSYDHRIIDGALGSQFMAEVVKELENWDRNKQI